MIEFLNYYFNWQILFSLCFVFLLLLRKMKVFNSSSLLKFVIFSLFVALLMPFVFSLTPAEEQPFGPVLRVWENPAVKEQALLPLSMSVEVPKPNSDLRLMVPSSGWLFLAVALFIYFAWGIGRMLKSFWQIKKIQRNSTLLRSIGKVRIWLSEEIAGPYSFFDGKAHIYIPYSQIFEPKILRLSLKHELQHHRQKDTLSIHFIELLNAFLGLNPLLRILRDQISEVQELACDEALIGQKGITAKEYSQCLFDLASKQSSSQYPIGAVGMAMEGKVLKRRIQKMFQLRRKTSRSALALAMSICLTLVTFSAWAFKGAVREQRLSLSEVQRLAEKTTRGQEIQVVVDEDVLRWLNRAVGNDSRRKGLKRSLERMQKYRGMIEEKLVRASLPVELLAVPLVESGYLNKAKSPVGAAGIWQFMPQTARHCGLRVDQKVDERLDPVRLTEAAVCYYEALFAIFQDWHVSTVAYYLGEHRMLRAIKKARHNDVRKLGREEHINQEASTYFSKLMAAMIIIKNPEILD